VTVSTILRNSLLDQSNSTLWLAEYSRSTAPDSEIRPTEK
jgi:hypothetical protein